MRNETGGESERNRHMKAAVKKQPEARWQRRDAKGAKIWKDALNRDTWGI
jgi:hypothetical protein